MSHQPEVNNSADRPAPAEAPTSALRETTQSARPPRPGMSDSTPAPVQLPVTPAGPVKASRSLWIMSFIVGLMIIGFAFLSRNEQMERLRETVANLEPNRDAATLDAAAAIALWGSLGALALVIVVEAALVSIMMRRRGWVRWLLLVILVLHVGVMLLGQAFLVSPDGDGLYLRILLPAQLLLATMALVVSVLPGAGAWFRAEHQTRGIRAA